jgi:hypothetical protein
MLPEDKIEAGQAQVPSLEQVDLKSFQRLYLIGVTAHTLWFGITCIQNCKIK